MISYILSLLITVLLLLYLIKKRGSLVSADKYFCLVILICFTIPQILNQFKPSIYTNLIILFGSISFLIPFYSNKKKNQKYSVYLATANINISVPFIFSLALVLLVLFTFIRTTYSVGLPGQSPSIPYSGIIFYLSTSFIFVLCLSLYLFSFYHQLTKFLLILALMLYSFYQGFLGWRQGVFDSMISIFILYPFLRFRISNHLKYTLFTLLILFTFGVIHYHNIFRDSNSTLFDAWHRLQGVRYLDTVPSYFIDLGHSFLTNDWFFTELYQTGQSTAEFHNLQIMRVSADTIHGSARTGFGSVYICFGLIGVIVCFFLLGFYYSILNNKMINNFDPFFTLFYTTQIILLQRIINEQLDYGVISHFISFAASIYFIKFVYLKLSLIKRATHASFSE